MSCVTVQEVKILNFLSPEEIFLSVTSSILIILFWTRNNVFSGTTMFFWRLERVITMAASKSNYEIKKSNSFIKFPYIRLGYLKFVGRRNSILILKYPFCCHFEYANGGGRKIRHPPPPQTIASRLLYWHRKLLHIIRWNYSKQTNQFRMFFCLHVLWNCPHHKAVCKFKLTVKNCFSHEISYLKCCTTMTGNK
jgi:hypothetical protein